MTILSGLSNFFIPPIKTDFQPSSELSLVLAQGRERILTAILRITAILAMIAIPSALPQLIQDGQWVSILCYTGSLGVVIPLGINRQINYTLRAGVLLFILYGLGLLDLLNYGLAEDARVYLFGFSVIAILLLGIRVGLAALSVSLVSIATVGWQISSGHFVILATSHMPSKALTLDSVIVFCTVFLVMTGLVMVAVYTLLHDFELAWLRERAAVTQLHQERDLLDQRVNERTHELAQARDQALAASNLKTELLAKVSHELRTPLGAILGFTEMLESGVYGDIAPAQQPVTTEIIGSAQYLTHLVNELLDEAQLEAGKLQLKFSAFTPTALVDETLAKMNILAEAKEIRLTSSISPEVPNLIWGDPTRLQQILVNLVGNAIKFTLRGTIQVKLFCPDAAHWAIQVADTGVGIPREAQAYIFEPFRQVDGSVTRSSQGTGLGLSIVKQLTTLMGGKIMLDSVENCGSTFTVILPLHKNPSQINNGENTK